MMARPGLVASALVAVSLLCGARLSSAEDLALPAEIEARLSARAASYERTLSSRAGKKVVIAIVMRASDQDSVRAASQLDTAFRDVGPINNLEHEDFVVPWKDGPTLRDVCAQRNVSIVFFAPGLDRELDAALNAIQPLRALTVAGALSYVKRGVILGFDLVSGRPKLVINLAMARKQGLDFRAELLRLVTVVE